MIERVGTCSICGGDVMGYRGAWMSILPPPADQCSSCGAMAAAGDVIPMVPRPFGPVWRYTTTSASRTAGDHIG